MQCFSQGEPLSEPSRRPRHTEGKMEDMEVDDRLPFPPFFHPRRAGHRHGRDDTEEDILLFQTAFCLMFSVPEPRPKIEGYIETVISRYNDEKFRQNFRLHRSTCEKLIADFATSTAYPDRSSHGGTPQKTPEHHILVFLWYAGNKTSIRDIAGRFGVSESTCHTMITRVMTHLCQIAYRIIRFPYDLDKLSSDFEQASSCTTLARLLIYSWETRRLLRQTKL
ncbi:hypothetical protein HPB47_020621 [Ixodes persulcatus]|uniref:Uncharacterized protein n=1 Tax=Ixodes persulcatus TaxID=34615 RepID=A0AC60QF45_IXOPE|nr:hypothetical protein HPB47_020621 [Ixodes persulcatus]